MQNLRITRFVFSVCISYQCLENSPICWDRRSPPIFPEDGFFKFSVCINFQTHPGTSSQFHQLGSITEGAYMAPWIFHSTFCNYTSAFPPTHHQRGIDQTDLIPGKVTPNSGSNVIVLLTTSALPLRTFLVSLCHYHKEGSATSMQPV